MTSVAVLRPPLAPLSRLDALGHRALECRGSFASLTCMTYLIRLHILLCEYISTFANQLLSTGAFYTASPITGVHMASLTTDARYFTSIPS
jgi:hypothetical protein